MAFAHEKPTVVLAVAVMVVVVAMIAGMGGGAGFALDGGGGRCYWAVQAREQRHEDKSFFLLQVWGEWKGKWSVIKLRIL